MKEFCFEGRSDDQMIERLTGQGADNCAQDDPIVALITSREGEMLVVAHYHLAPHGTWTIGVAPFDELTPVPDWPVRIGPGTSAHSPALYIEAPDDATVGFLAAGRP